MARPSGGPAFYLEYDTGTEDVGTLIAKLTAYDRHVAKGGPPWPVLFRLPSPARERHLHLRLAGSGPHPYVIATAWYRERDLADPASIVWTTQADRQTLRGLHEL